MWKLIGLAFALLTFGAASSGVTVLVLRDMDPNAGAANLLAAKMLDEAAASKAADAGFRESAARAYEDAQRAAGRR